jgi:lantibiotic modifying enzyme
MADRRVGRFLAHAAAIAAVLRDNAVDRPGGGVTWQSPPAQDGKNAPIAGPHIYDGILGIALFLAAHDHVRRCKDNRDLVLQAIAPLRRTLRELIRDQERAGRILMLVGGLVGLGAFVYAFVRIGEWLGEDALIGEAHGLTRLFTHERIRADRQLDVVGGCAGAVLGLLVLDGAGPRTNPGGVTPVDLASACANHLVEHRSSLRGRPRAWAAPGKPPLGGFAHGASGIGHALLRLFNRTGDEPLLNAAREAFDFERSLFEPQKNNWLDPRTGRLLEQSAWCHGAPGIALSRLASPDLNEGETAELQGLLQIARSIPDASLDHLCCGNLGRADILLCAGEVLGDTTLTDDALALADRTVGRAEQAGDFSLRRPGEASGLRPAYFHGLSGVGYALLRLASPRTLPCTLRLE